MGFYFRGLAFKQTMMILIVVTVVVGTIFGIMTSKMNGKLEQMTIDNGEPTVFTLKEPFRSEQWKQNVLRGQALRQLKARLTPGPHTLSIQALDHHIVLDQIIIK